MICEWCGAENAEYEVTLPGNCCHYFICDGCVSAGEERGGGTAFCCRCGKIIRIREAGIVTEQWKRSWRHRSMKITRWVCREGCQATPVSPASS
jgi:hypothetical protein